MLNSKLKKTLIGAGVAVSLAATVPVFSQPYIMENVNENNTPIDILNENILVKEEIADKEIFVNCKLFNDNRKPIKELICETKTIRELIQKVQITQEAKKNNEKLSSDKLLTISEYYKLIKIYNIEVQPTKTNLIGKIFN